jgi:predicted DNA-binding transcriptional regulator AlpA
MTPREELMAAALSAPEDRIGEAIRQLRGETPKPLPQKKELVLVGMTKAGELLGVSRVTIWRMCRAGIFEKIHLIPGGSARLRRSDLEAFVANGGIQGDERLKEKIAEEGGE